MQDVVVVGGGLAGCATAIRLARSGLSVSVLERSKMPGRKSCGEGLFPAGVEALSKLGVNPGEEGAALRGVRFIASNATAEAPFAGGRTALGIRREVLDTAIRARARDEGVCVRTGVSVFGIMTGGGRVRAVETSAGDIEARAFVAADGLGSRMRRLAGLEGRRPGRRYGISAHVAMADELEPVVQVWFGEGLEVYLTPVGARVANLAVLTRRAEMARFAGGLRTGFVATVARHPALRHGFELTDEPLAAGPFARSCSRAWRGNVVLAGDAAGFFDGITGEGMTAALLGAELAARAVTGYLESGSYAPLRDYERKRRSLVRNAEALGRMSLVLSRWHPAARRTVANLGARPDTFARLVAINTGDAGFRSLGIRDAGALLFGR